LVNCRCGGRPAYKITGKDEQAAVVCFACLLWMDDLPGIVRKNSRIVPETAARIIPNAERPRNYAAFHIYSFMLGFRLKRINVPALDGEDSFSFVQFRVEFCYEIE